MCALVGVLPVLVFITFIWRDEEYIVQVIPQEERRRRQTHLRFSVFDFSLRERSDPEVHL